METSLLRQLPFSAEAEMSVLGAILLNHEKLNEVASILKTEDFYITDNQEIYDCLMYMFNLGKTIDIVTVIEALKTRGIFDQVGGKEYLTQLLDIVPAVSNIMSYVRIIEEKSNLRKLMVAADEILAMCINQSDDPKDILDLSEQKIYSIMHGRNLKGFASIKEIILDAYDRLQKLSQDKNAFAGTATGFRDLDHYLVGLNSSDLCLIAARPGMGKTSFALNIAQNVAQKAGKAVAIFSLEMSKEQLITRMLSSEAMVDSLKLRTGELNNEDWGRLAAASGVLSSAPIYIDDASGIGVVEMKAKCRRLSDLGLIVIDYLQLMQGSRRNDNRVQEISEITRSLKIMAKELDVPIICLSQLSRGPESRTDKRPMLSDLRESGAIEQDADCVLFLYRDDYYDPDSEKRNVAECIIAKNRHGSTGKLELQWLGQFTRFSTQEKTSYDQ